MWLASESGLCKHISQHFMVTSAPEKFDQFPVSSSASPVGVPWFEDIHNLGMTLMRVMTVVN